MEIVINAVGIFLIVGAFFLFIFGILLLLSPKTLTKISKMTNRVMFTVDEKMPILRRPLGVLFLATSVFFWIAASIR